jgi:hypothetical protein
MRLNISSMKRVFLLLALAVATTDARAQLQDDKMHNWVDSNFQRAVDATNGTGDKAAARSSVSDKSFDAGGFSAKTFGAREFSGTKSASLKTYETRSFLGIRNPWFGNKVYATATNSVVNRTAQGAAESYQTDSFGVKDYDKASKKDLVDAGAQVPTTEKPRPYLVAPKAAGVMDRFTENLQTELSIDDVRDLLNKGKAR